MGAVASTRDRRHRRRLRAAITLLTLSVVATAGYLFDLEWTARRELERWWLLIVTRAPDGTTRVSLGGHSDVSANLAWPELAEGEYVALVINGWSTERCPRHWLFDGLLIEHKTTYQPHRLSDAPEDDPSLAFGQRERIAGAALVSEILDGFAIRPRSITQGGSVRQSNVPRIVLRTGLLALIVLSLCVCVAFCGLIVRDWLREQFERCPRCGYRLQGLPDEARVCPECGDDRTGRAG